MKKLCLILTVLYAIWANCSAQSLNIAQNLLEGNSSTFESGMGSWTCNDYGACSIARESGRNGNYLKLTNTGAGNDCDKQMEYSLSGHTPAKGKRYVIKFWAKRNGDSGNGKINVLLQKNEAGTWPQQAFNNNPFDVTNDVTNEWKLYEFDITPTRDDYEVIKINFGDCGEVWIDDIEYGEYSANVTPVHATGVTLDKTSASVKQGKTITLTATVEPADAVNKNVTWSSNDASVATVNNGVVTGVATGNAKITVTTEDGSHTASCTVTVTTSLPPVLIADFNDIASLDGTISPHYPNGVTPTRSENMYIDLIADPYSDGKCVAVSDGNHKMEEYCTINLPDDLNIKDYGILAFDICYPEKSTDAGGQHESMNYKSIPISLIYTDRNSTTQTVQLAKFNTPVFPAPVWDTKMIGLKPLASIDFEGASNFQIKIGPINSNRCIYYLDNIRIKENVDDVDYTQDDDLSDIWWKYADETLYIKGTGPIPAYTGSKKCPWKDLGDDRTPYIKHVIVSEGITGIGDYSVGNSQKDNVDITLHSIPEYFGVNCLKRENAEHLTRTLHLELWDAEKPFIAKSKSTYFPTFNTAKYFRNVTNTYSTVCLPFPVAEKTVTDAGAELFDFTSIKKNGEQYTLAFKKHSGGMAAGQTYLIKKHDIEGTLQNTDVTKEQFNLIPSVSTNTVDNSDPSFSISMTGVFQPSVFGPNLGTKDAPVYAYGFLNEKFYMNGGNMSVRPMRGYFKGSQLYSAPGYGEQQQPGAKKMPKMFNFEIVPDTVTHISSPAFIAEDFNIEEVYSPSGMKTESLNKGLNIIRTSTGRVLKVMVK